jgi:hypothetical protein
VPKGKKKKQRRPQVPALSWGDKAIYNVLVALSVVMSFVALFLFVWLQGRMTAEPGVLAVSDNPLGGFVLWAYVFIHMGIFLDLKLHKVHLFGRRDITYGPPKWKEAYPIFRKHPKVSRKPTELRMLRMKWIAYLVGWAAVLVACCMTFFPRQVWMMDGSVKVYDRSNQLIQHYSHGDIEQLCFETTWSKSGKGFTARYRAELQVRIRMEDGTEILFSYRELYPSERALEAMVDLKNSLPEGTVSCLIDKEYTPEDVIRDNDYTPEEAALLRQLFAP